MFRKNEKEMNMSNTTLEKKNQEWALARPLADIYQQGDLVFIELEMPMVKKDSIDVAVEKGELVIKAEPTALQGEYQNHYNEFSPLRYQRSFRLGDELDKESIEASYKNGVLQVAIKKSVSFSRKVEVKDA